MTQNKLRILGMAVAIIACLQPAFPADMSPVSAQEVQQLMARRYNCPGFQESAGLVTSIVLTGPGGDVAGVVSTDFRSRRVRHYSEFKPQDRSKSKQVKGDAWLDGVHYYCRGESLDLCIWRSGYPGEEDDEVESANQASYFAFMRYLEMDAGGATLKLLDRDPTVEGSVFKLEITAPEGKPTALHLDQTGKIIAQESPGSKSPILIRFDEFETINGCELATKSSATWRGRPDLSGFSRLMTYDFRKTMDPSDTAITVNGETK